LNPCHSPEREDFYDGRAGSRAIVANAFSRFCFACACVLYTLDGNIDLKFMKLYELFIWADNFNCFDSGRREHCFKD
jgi:hypothetical protein